MGRYILYKTKYLQYILARIHLVSSIISILSNNKALEHDKLVITTSVESRNVPNSL